MSRSQPDPLGRFAWPIPWYSPAELDDMFEAHGAGIFAKRHKGSPLYLLTTDDLSVLIEEAGADLDPGFEFGGDETDVFGKTIFRRNETLVRVSRQVAETPSLTNLYRMTLAHEYGHLVLHRRVYEPCFNDLPEVEEVYRGGATSEHPDPLEWQAGRAAAGLLIPKSVLARIAGPNFRPLPKGSADARGVADLVAKRFQTSVQAAAIRLEHLGYIYEPGLSIERWPRNSSPRGWRTREGLVHCSATIQRMIGANLASQRE